MTGTMFCRYRSTEGENFVINRREHDMHHGEHAIKPVNILLICGLLVLWATTFPVWTTLVFAIPTAVFMFYCGRDTYGGMQLVFLIAIAMSPSVVSMAKRYRSAIQAGEDPALGSLALESGAIFLGTVIGLIGLIWISIGLIFAGVRISEKFKARRDSREKR